MKDINIINNKRLQKEIGIYLDLFLEKKMLKKCKKANLIDFTENTAFFDMKINNININILIEFSSFYPFKNPKVLINNHNYLDYLRVDNKRLKEVEYENACLCCNSILCKWYASHTIYHLLEEIHKNFSLKLRILNRLYCKKITDQIFGTYIPIIEFL